MHHQLIVLALISSVWSRPAVQPKPQNDTFADTHGIGFTTSSIRMYQDEYIPQLPFLYVPPSTCPPPVMPVQDFNLDTYVSGRWYVQQQMVTQYQQPQDNFCVTAKYTKLKQPGPKWWLSLLSWLGYSPEEVDVKVDNYANTGLNGMHKGAVLRAVVLDPKKPTQLLVGPTFIPRAFWGPYWVVAAGPSPARYDWAIVSGGAPKITGDNFYCQTGSGTNGAGLWLFTRSRIVPNDTVAYLNMVARGLGYDTTVLNPVVQDGCKYNKLDKHEKSDD